MLDFETGQEVYDIIRQEVGYLRCIESNIKTGISDLYVDFGLHPVRYTDQGINAIAKNKTRTLYSIDDIPNIIEIIKPIKLRPNLSVDAPVLVWDRPGGIKRRRYFKEWPKKATGIECFSQGATSWSANKYRKRSDRKQATCWLYYSIPGPEDL